MNILDKDGWRNMFLIETPKLYQVTDKIKEFIEGNTPKLAQTIKKHDIYLESLFASAFMTLFSNLIPLNYSLRILDRFILCKFLYRLMLYLDGEKGIMDIIKHILRMKEDYLASLDCWEFQVYLSKKIYEQCIEEENFFPPFKSNSLPSHF